MRTRVSATLIALACGGCASLIHGPTQNVRVESNPPGAAVTIYPQQSERGPLFLKEEQLKITTPATVRLQRDTTYRLEFQKPGYVIGEKKVVSRYNWLTAPLVAGPAEAVGELPTPKRWPWSWFGVEPEERVLPLRFVDAVFYEYPVGAVRSVGKSLRILSPEAVVGHSFKLKSEDDGYFRNWHGVGTPVVRADLTPIQ